jgi:hypothetical protein
MAERRGWRGTAGAAMAVDGGADNGGGAGRGTCAGGGKREMANGTGSIFLPSEGEKIPSRIARRAKYRVCWIRFLVRFLFY